MNTQAIVTKNRRQKRGQTVVEYALVLLLLAIASIGIAMSTGGQIQNLYTSITGSISAGQTAATTSAPPPPDSLPAH